MNQTCTNTYITKEGKEVACMGYMKLKQEINKFSKEDLYKCDLCGYTVLVKKKEVTEL